GLTLAVRGGGHSFPGFGTWDDGLVIDLSHMKAIHVDPVARTVRAEGGVKWGEFDAATQQYNLATTGGTDIDTGIAGLTLGGGIGYLQRAFGYTCDNLLAADIVLADGRRVRASEHENSDLFWGLRGGGGNFGVVTAFEYRLHALGPSVLSGTLIYPLDQVRAVADFQREYMRDAPDELGVFNVFFMAPPLERFTAALHGQKLLYVRPIYAGDPAEGERFVAPLRAVGNPIADTVGPTSYSTVQQALSDALPRGVHAWSRVEYLRDLDSDALALIADHYSRAPGSQTFVAVSRLGGVIAKLPIDATALAHRDEPYFVWIICAWSPDEPDEPGIAWTRALSEALRPFTTGGTYVNAMQDETEKHRIGAAYPPHTFDRLVALKRVYDPTNLFHLNQNIVP
ncbi:MAG TPA: FAD-binding oxidoreductase, partial [Ktedonobacterales bacterium]|nr:FAD-binding oxidoreductase [Ktedonobacterales bacterium]